MVKDLAQVSDRWRWSASRPWQRSKPPRQNKCKRHRRHSCHFHWLGPFGLHHGMEMLLFGSNGTCRICKDFWWFEMHLSELGSPYCLSIALQDMAMGTDWSPFLNRNTGVSPEVSPSSLRWQVQVRFMFVFFFWMVENNLLFRMVSTIGQQESILRKRVDANILASCSLSCTNCCCCFVIRSWIGSDVTNRTN